jgi:hypothetical protein
MTTPSMRAPQLIALRASELQSKVVCMLSPSSAQRAVFIALDGRLIHRIAHYTTAHCCTTRRAADIHRSGVRGPGTCGPPSLTERIPDFNTSTSASAIKLKHQLHSHLSSFLPSSSLLRAARQTTRNMSTSTDVRQRRGVANGSSGKDECDPSASPDHAHSHEPEQSHDHSHTHSHGLFGHSHANDGPSDQAQTVAKAFESGASEFRHVVPGIRSTSNVFLLTTQPIPAPESHS